MSAPDVLPFGTFNMFTSNDFRLCLPFSPIKDANGNTSPRPPAAPAFAKQRFEVAGAIMALAGQQSYCEVKRHGKREKCIVGLAASVGEQGFYWGSNGRLLRDPLRDHGQGRVKNIGEAKASEFYEHLSVKHRELSGCECRRTDLSTPTKRPMPRSRSSSPAPEFSPCIDHESEPTKRPRLISRSPSPPRIAAVAESPSVMWSRAFADAVEDDSDDDEDDSDDVEHDSDDDDEELASGTGGQYYKAIRVKGSEVNEKELGSAFLWALKIINPSSGSHAGRRGRLQSSVILTAISPPDSATTRLHRAWAGFGFEQCALRESYI
ncbi:hypothetical protein BDK51DRAFT_52962 [Blyttiomyces helicus]|uniref:Uncharacterized protein n=1 Tax=Blyttiomyces helicus TaxID=388810 RepID=A0A4P9W632_9FUNG|nr:hypothetical protein BDK51DRAFT_52962 [Blyttiomyces helicus]|eukprot:RKO87754.1 hypothetical protein BDK51DRAFT_52962 [Blyttiomyces helicus]